MQEDSKKVSTRGQNNKVKLSNYNGCFVERENAVILCQELQAIHTKLLLEMDAKNIEDMQFDRLLGKVPNQSPI